MKVSISDLHFSYPQQSILENINATFPSASITAILGVNGAGKTTLLKSMSRLIKPKKGSVLLNDIDLTNLKRAESAKVIGLVSQTHETARLRVIDYLLIGRTPYRKFRYIQSDEEIAKQTLASLDLSRLADQWLDELSGGELQQVVIARALVQQPEVLLLDEPTNNLDLKNQLVIMKLLRRCSKQLKMTIVFSIHDINLAFRFADRFLLLNDGKVLSVGDRQSLSAELLSHAYGTPLAIHRLSGQYVILPEYKKSEEG